MRSDLPWGYFITFRTYASFLHGSTKLSVDPSHNLYRSRKIAANDRLEKAMISQCLEELFILSKDHRETALSSIKETCRYFSWELYAAHVRTNHVHFVVKSTSKKEDILRKVKAYATRALRQQHAELSSRKKYWSKHGSTKIIWDESSVLSIMHYIIAEQGEPMALFYKNEVYQEADRLLYAAYREIYDN